MTDQWEKEQVAAGLKIIGDGIACTKTSPHKVFWRPGEREKRETDKNWRWAQRIMIRRAT